MLPVSALQDKIWIQIVVGMGNEKIGHLLQVIWFHQNNNMI
jgi:hypothetical protein